MRMRNTGTQPQQYRAFATIAEPHADTRENICHLHLGSPSRSNPRDALDGLLDASCELARNFAVPADAEEELDVDQTNTLPATGGIWIYNVTHVDEGAQPATTDPAALMSGDPPVSG